ncbi:hypothetical protein [Macrococcus brunensis]|nr:hypothetical protein [Macrococcus brunensis]ULG73863.1 hypothetical protein MGG13_09405 [Macrococcus brunensis]
MNTNLLLTYVMLIVALAFGLLTLFVPEEVRIGSAIASVIMSFIFYRLYLRDIDKEENKYYFIVHLLFLR